MRRGTVEIGHEERSESEVAEDQDDPERLTGPLGEQERFVEVCGRAFVAALRDGHVARVVVEPSKSVDVAHLAIKRRDLRDLGVDIDDPERERPKREGVGDEPLVAGLASVRQCLLRQRPQALGVVHARSR